jgi:tetratricopeptide (TPR) repeat protein
MQSPNEEPQTCWFCNKRPATVRYTHTTSKQMISEMVCATCLDRLEVQDAYEYKARDIFDLEMNECYDEALACLDAFLDANRHRDHDKWLTRSVANHRALMLFAAGRYMEGEKACEAWAQLGFADVGERWEHGFETARTLDALGRSQEGLAVLEDALSHQDPKYVPGASGKLKKLAEISEKLGQPVDPKWRSLAEEVAESYGVEMPEHESLGKAILELSKAIRKTERMRRGEEEPSDDDDEP